MPVQQSVRGEWLVVGGADGDAEHALTTHRSPLTIHRMQAIGLAVLLLLPAACQQQMAAQPSYKPLEPSEFFPDGRSARPLVTGTVARGHLRSDADLFTGMRARKTGDLERA